MNRLITFGCSFTFGTYLEDCPFDSQIPSNYAWPTITARNLNLNLINTSHRGSSNLEILYKILNFKFHESDTVVILWSLSGRGCIFEKDNYKRYGVWMPEYSDWLGCRTEYHLKIESWLMIHHAELYLNSLKIKNLSYLYDQGNMNKDKPSFINIQNLKDVKGIFRNKLDVTPDNIHPGPLTHKEFANLVCNDIQK